MSTIEQPGPRLTDWDRFLIAEARRLAAQRDRGQLERETLRQLADLAERLGGAS